MSQAGSTTPTQIHDFDPGNVPGGLFWTIAIPDDSVTANPEAGKASLAVKHLSTRDFGTVGNALTHGSSIPATVSFHVEWTGAVTRPSTTESAKFKFRSVKTGAHINWSGSSSTGDFHSSPTKQTVKFAELGHDRNGVFLDDPNDED
jgi:hypothetical protein